jgi:hypothetical protein
MRPTDPVTTKTEESPVERAARRSAELRGHADVDEGNDEYFVEPGVIPTGRSLSPARAGNTSRCPAILK